MSSTTFALTSRSPFAAGLLRVPDSMRLLLLILPFGEELNHHTVHVRSHVILGTITSAIFLSKDVANEVLKVGARRVPTVFVVSYHEIAY